MGREDDPQAEIAELEQMLKDKNMPEEAREKGMSELKKLRMMAPASAEYAIVRNYVDWILELPWNDMRETSIDIPEARAILDADHFGLEKPKQPRPPAHLRGSHARQDHHGPQTRQVQQPVVLP